MMTDQREEMDKFVKENNLKTFGTIPAIESTDKKTYYKKLKQLVKTTKAQGKLCGHKPALLFKDVFSALRADIDDKSPITREELVNFGKITSGVRVFVKDPIDDSILADEGN